MFRGYVYVMDMFDCISLLLARVRWFMSKFLQILFWRNLYCGGGVDLKIKMGSQALLFS